MRIIKQTAVFEKWFNSLKDFQTVKIISREIDKLALGITAHIKSLGQGLFELKIHTGRGIRIYFVNRNDEIIILLSGGDKSTQSKDIETARKLKEELE